MCCFVSFEVLCAESRRGISHYRRGERGSWSVAYLQPRSIVRVSCVWGCRPVSCLVTRSTFPHHRPFKWFNHGLLHRLQSVASWIPTTILISQPIMERLFQGWNKSCTAELLYGKLFSEGLRDSGNIFAMTVLLVLLLRYWKWLWSNWSYSSILCWNQCTMKAYEQRDRGHKTLLGRTNKFILTISKYKFMKWWVEEFSSGGERADQMNVQCRLIFRNKIRKGFANDE